MNVKILNKQNDTLCMIEPSESTIKSKGNSFNTQRKNAPFQRVFQ